MNRRRLVVVLSWACLVVAVAGAAFVAGRWTFSPPEVGATDRPVAMYTVADATVGESLGVTVNVTWKVTSIGVNAATGTVTSVANTGLDAVSAGDVLYTVNLRPVVVAQGAVPAFRDLGRGAEGADVTQLQQFLVDGGYLSAAPDGKFGGGTEAAVKAWQRALGEERTGIVLAGDLLFVESLPVRIVLDEELYVGAQIASGTQVVSVVSAEPTFVATVSSDQIAGLATSGLDVVITSPSGSWSASTGPVMIDDAGTATVELEPAQGDSICADACGTLDYSLTGVVLNAQIMVTPTASGPAVPLSALGTAANGDAFVVDAAGERIVVEVVASDGSLSLVTEVSSGDEIRLFAIEDSATSDQDPSATDAS